MVQLVALLSTGKGTWTEVAALIRRDEFDELILLTNAFGKQAFSQLPSKKTHVVVCDFEKSVAVLSEAMIARLKPLIGFNDIAVNMSSGTGHEHMALFAALMRLGTSFRLVTMHEGSILDLSADPAFNRLEK